MNEGPHSELDAVVEILASTARPALACHVSPDGDALGSMLAMHHALRAAGRDPVSSFSEPFVVAPHYRELPGLELLTPPSEFPEAPEVLVTFDCGSLDRLGDLVAPAKAAGELIVLDHHASNDRYGSINVIDPAAAATAVLVHRIVSLADWMHIDRPTAYCLYTGIVCDTGRFQYDSTGDEVFSIARELMAFDLPLARLNRTLFEEHRFDYLQLVGELLGRTTLVPDRRFVWVAVTQDDLRRHGVSFEETEGLIDLVRRAREADVACVVKEEPDGMLKVSLRSVGDIDVCAIAKANGGGGHRFAAGFSSERSIDDTIDRILADLPVAS